MFLTFIYIWKHIKNVFYVVKRLNIIIVIIVQNVEFSCSFYYSRRRYWRRPVWAVPDNQPEDQQKQGVSLICSVLKALNIRAT